MRNNDKTFSNLAVCTLGCQHIVSAVNNEVCTEKCTSDQSMKMSLLSSLDMEKFIHSDVGYIQRICLVDATYPYAINAFCHMLLSLPWTCSIAYLYKESQKKGTFHQRIQNANILPFPHPFQVFPALQSAQCPLPHGAESGGCSPPSLVAVWS